MYCWNCGKEIEEEAFFCVHCGVKTDRSSYINNNITLREQERTTRPAQATAYLASFSR